MFLLNFCCILLTGDTVLIGIISVIVNLSMEFMESIYTFGTKHASNGMIKQITFAAVVTYILTYITIGPTLMAH